MARFEGVADERILFVGNTGTQDISIVDTALGREISAYDTQLLATQELVVRQQQQLGELTVARETLLGLAKAANERLAFAHTFMISAL